jgi:hypothetical protein
MTPAEQLVSRQLHALADIPVSELDVERAHHELRARLAPTRPRRPVRGPIAAAVAVALTMAAVAVWVGATRSRSDEPTHPTDAAALRAATGFVDAFADVDVRRARRWMSTKATTAGDLGRDWAAVSRYFAATGRIIPQRCHAVSGTGGTTYVVCPFSYQLLGSAELGRGPYRGSYFDLTTRAGRVARASMYFEYRNGFNAQMWSPMATWMNRTHPHDAAVMYADFPDDSAWQLSDRAIRLWAHRAQDFVRFLESVCSTHTSRPAVDPNACTGIRAGGLGTSTGP